MIVERVIVAVFVIGAVAAAASLAGQRPDAESIGRRAAQEALRDPSSAKFRAVETHTSRDGRHVAVCGQISGKNLFGVQADFVGFVSVVSTAEGQNRAAQFSLQDPVAPSRYSEDHRKFCYAGFFYY